MDYFQSAGINTYQNPLSLDGNLIHAVNVVSYPLGGKSKRPGYNAFLGTPDTAQVNSLFAFSNIGNDATKTNLYRASGSILYHSLQGTGAWTVSQNGTISNGAHFGAAIGNGGTALIGGDGIGSTRHTTTGTSFINTTLAPVASYFEEFQNRAYAAGTASDLFYSTTNDITNWNTSGTSDSNSLRIPGGGKLSQIYKTPDQLIIPKTSGQMYKWDGNSLIDRSTSNGPASPYSISKAEHYPFFINQFGHFGDGGANPQLLSNAVQNLFYNPTNTGISSFGSIPAVCHIYDYFASIGTVTDDFTHRTVNNAILNYNYQKNEYLLWQMTHNPTSYLSYVDINSKRQLLFGDANGQCYQLDRTARSDAGQVIPTEMVFVFTYGAAALEKKWNWLRLFFNPGCEMNIQVAFSNTFTYEHLQWTSITDFTPNPSNRTDDGIFEVRFPQESRSRLMFLRLYEADLNSAWRYYGASIDAEPIPRK